jgi:Protein of unknown function (DUF2493).
MKRILITGAREWQDENAVQDAIFEWVYFNSPEPEEIVVVHGDAARGADRMARDFARACDWITEEAHPADWSWGNGGGALRNIHMVSLGADVCLAFIRGKSAGTRHCAGEAAKAGIPVIRYVDNPDEEA